MRRSGLRVLDCFSGEALGEALGGWLLELIAKAGASMQPQVQRAAATQTSQAPGCALKLTRTCGWCSHGAGY